jgi:hypothetical protein
VSIVDEAARILAEARRTGAAVAVTSTGTATVILVSPPAVPATDLVRLVDAAAIAVTTVRVIRDAIRRGDLKAVGGQRDRAVRRPDLAAWVESRAVRHDAVDDLDLDRRMRRLARERRTA